MKIVIDIPRKTYEHIRSYGGHGIFNMLDDDNLIVTKAIFNSTPYEDRPQGYWLNKQKEGWNCSECGEWSRSTDDFCKGCGADMRGDRE